MDPSWRTAELKEWTEDLIRDVNNPVDNDPYFAQFRSWDWFAGHSWAGGIKVNGALDGRDQESVPEVIFVCGGGGVFFTPPTYVDTNLQKKSLSISTGDLNCGDWLQTIRKCPIWPTCN